jgi:hypothetical protein
MQSDNTEESSMDRVLTNRLTDALSEMAGLRIPVSLNDPSITDHDNTIPPKNGRAKKMRDQKETERAVFKSFWTATKGFCPNTAFHLMPRKFVLIAMESFDLKQLQNGRVDTIGKKMSIQVRYTARDDVYLDTSVGKGAIIGSKTTCLCRGTVVNLIHDESQSYYVILACYDKMVGNKYFMSKDECQQLLDISNHGKKNTKSKTDTVKLHVGMVEEYSKNMKESTSTLKAVWRN